MAAPLMPKATAAWLLDNTTLTFEQIAEFCHLHPLEVQALADGETFIVGVDPVATDQLSPEEIEMGSKDPQHKLRLKQEISSKMRRTGGPKYTPLNRRQDKPDAVFWLLQNCGALSHNQIIKLVGTTKGTIDKIRDRAHWNQKNLKPRSPVELGLCTQADLDECLSVAESREKRASEKVDSKSPKRKSSGAKG